MACNLLFTRCKVYTINLQILTRFRNYTIVSQSQNLKIVNSNHLVWLPIQCSDQLNPVSQYTSSILILANLTREIDFCLEMAFMHLLQFTRVPFVFISVLSSLILMYFLLGLWLGLSALGILDSAITLTTIIYGYFKNLYFF